MDAQIKLLQAQQLAVMGMKLLGTNSEAQRWLQKYASDPLPEKLVTVDDPMVPIEILDDGIDNDDDPISRHTRSEHFSVDDGDDAPSTQ